MEAFLILALSVVSVFRILFIVGVVLAKDVRQITRYEKLNKWFIGQLIPTVLSPNVWTCLFKGTLDKLLIVQFVLVTITYGFFYLVGYNSLAEFILYLTLLDIFVFIPILKSKIATQQNLELS